MVRSVEGLVDGDLRNPEPLRYLALGQLLDVREWGAAYIRDLARS
ncbi:MAG: hypothetical protein AVDCRST_MAG01-01-4869 [uncultured Rubrobacteraceae bacterium]|uniref:Uncharacterized protein n=1 Tax=uncultured Rubrobacteraceae bacterium TaxID=349277 RepID=A0A6J4QYN7_9ACTN|nr:MAG: hypothetical protein AVDCRST_MAG01-01-4869 [uncultured Rubrobacteraceae bacterium]